MKMPIDLVIDWKRTDDGVYFIWNDCTIDFCVVFCPPTTVLEPDIAELAPLTPGSHESFDIVIFGWWRQRCVAMFIVEPV